KSPQNGVSETGFRGCDRFVSRAMMLLQQAGGHGVTGIFDLRLSICDLRLKARAAAAFSIANRKSQIGNQIAYAFNFAKARRTSACVRGTLYAFCDSGSAPSSASAAALASVCSSSALPARKSSAFL